jgi:hypothetical protein
MLSKFVVSMVDLRRLGRRVRRFLTHGLQTNASLGFLGDMWTGGAVEVRAAVALCAGPAHDPVCPIARRNRSWARCVRTCSRSSCDWTPRLWSRRLRKPLRAWQVAAGQIWLLTTSHGRAAGGGRMGRSESIHRPER